MYPHVDIAWKKPFLARWKCWVQVLEKGGLPSRHPALTLRHKKPLTALQ